jgi:hypothetical protein
VFSSLDNPCFQGLFVITGTGNFISWQNRRKAQTYFIIDCFSMIAIPKTGIKSAKLLLTIKIKLLFMIKISLPFVSTYIIGISFIPPPETFLPFSFLIFVGKKLCV